MGLLKDLLELFSVPRRLPGLLAHESKQEIELRRQLKLRAIVEPLQLAGNEGQRVLVRGRVRAEAGLPHRTTAVATIDTGGQQAVGFWLLGPDGGRVDVEISFIHVLRRAPRLATDAILLDDEVLVEGVCERVAAAPPVEQNGPFRASTVSRADGWRLVGTRLEPVRVLALD